MSTIDNKPIIRELIKNNGYYASDPQVKTIWQYYSPLAGHPVWAIYYDVGKMPNGNAAIDPQMLWSNTYGITPDGAEFMKENA